MFDYQVAFHVANQSGHKSGCNHNHKKVAISIHRIIIQPFPPFPRPRCLWWYKRCYQIQGMGARPWGLPESIASFVKKTMRWLELVCWHFCYLAGKRTDPWWLSISSSQGLEDNPKPYHHWLYRLSCFYRIGDKYRIDIKLYNGVNKSKVSNPCDVIREKSVSVVNYYYF